MLEENLIKIYEKSFRENREFSALTDYFKQETYSYFEMAKEIARLHLLFEYCGIKKGDKIAIIGRNNPHWVMTYVATITYGAVIVPMLQDFSPNDVNHIIKHSDSKLLFVGDSFWDIIEENDHKVLLAAFSLTDSSCIWEREGVSVANYQRNIHKHFRERYPLGFRVEDISYPDVPNDALCLLNYTSGTTGFTKGVMLSVNNLTGNTMIMIEHNTHVRGSRVLAFLPLAHAYGCMVDMVSPLAVGAHVTLLGKMPAPKILIEALSVVKPHVVCSVPMLVEKIIRKQVLPKVSGGFMGMVMKTPGTNKVAYAAIGRKLMALFGGEVKEMIIGGAPINREIEEFLAKTGFPFCVGYGMTECAPLISYEDPENYKLGSCGRVLTPYMEIKIDSEKPYEEPGEILTRGENVMMGYYKNPKATAEAFDEDGWLRTGDIGTTDEIGTIYIRGRSKAMILSSNGQNIYPEEIESKLNGLPCVMESLVLDRDGKLVALVVPDFEQMAAMGIRDKKLEGLMKDNLKELNGQLAAYERVAEIVLYPAEFEKTPKKSIKRYLYTRDGGR